MGLSYNQVTASGLTKSFPVTFNYINKTDVHVYVDDVEDTSFTWTSNYMIELSTMPAAGAIVIIRRETAIATPRVDYSDGTVQNEGVADLAFNNVFMPVQELNDMVNTSVIYDSVNDVMDGQAKILRNIGAGILSSDGLTLLQAQTYTANIISTILAQVAAAQAASTQTSSNLTSIQTIYNTLLANWNITVAASGTNYSIKWGTKLHICYGQSTDTPVTFASPFSKSNEEPKVFIVAKVPNEGAIVTDVTEVGSNYTGFTYDTNALNLSSVDAYTIQYFAISGGL
jgi:hypothetical protein